MGIPTCHFIFPRTSTSPLCAFPHYTKNRPHFRGAGLSFYFPLRKAALKLSITRLAPSKAKPQSLLLKNMVYPMSIHS